MRTHDRELGSAASIAALALVFVLASEATAARRDLVPEVTGPYLGQKPPGARPVLFAPGIISTDLHDDFSPAFTPQGSEVFFRCIGNGRMIILHMSLEAGRWSHPEVAVFSGEYRDAGVCIASDGARLFFSSDRPVNGADTTGDLDIFAVDRTAGGWGEPYYPFASKDGSGDAMGCSVDSEGTLYWHARRSSGFGGYDIYRSKPTGGVYSGAELLQAPINTSGDETCPCIARDGSFIIFSSDGRPAAGGAGLYASFRNPEGSWTPSVNLTKRMGLTLPAKYAGLSPDGRYLFFVVPESKEANRRLGRRWEIEAFRGAEPRYGGGNVYWVNASVIDGLRPRR